MFNIFEPFKLYIMAAGAAAVAIFIAVFKYRGNKVDELEAVVASKDKEIEVAAKVVAQEKEVATFVADNRVAKVTGEVDVKETTKYDPSTKFYI